MVSIIRPKILYNDSAAGDGTWYDLDYRFNTGSEQRTIQGQMNASDEIVLEGVSGAEGVTKREDITAADVTPLKSYTGVTEFNDVIEGPWAFIRVRKVGTAGNAKVQGNI